MINKILKSGNKVFLDTMVFIYYFENHHKFLHILSAIFTSIEKSYVKGYTSTITMAEILVKPYKLKDFEAAQDYQTIISQLPNFSIVPITSNIANTSAFLCAEYGLGLADAMQISGAIETKSDFFISNDYKLKKIKEIKIVCLNDLAK